MTGLDVDALLQKVTIGLTGLGGPFVPADRRLRAARRRHPASVVRWISK